MSRRLEEIKKRYSLWEYEPPINDIPSPIGTAHADFKYLIDLVEKLEACRTAANNCRVLYGSQNSFNDEANDEIYKIRKALKEAEE